MVQREKKRVLVVEDDQPLARAIELRLLQEGYYVDVADDGQAALSIMSRTQPDFILLDLVMPHMDGIDLLKALRVEQGSTVSVIVLTAMASGVLFEQCKELTVEDYLIKDQVSLDQITAKIKALAK